MKFLLLLIALLLIILVLRVNTKQGQPIKEKSTIKRMISIRKRNHSEIDGKNYAIIKTINATKIDLNNLFVDSVMGIDNQPARKKAINHLGKGGVIS